MAPLTRALHVTRHSDSPENTCGRYTAEADPEWVIGRVSNGGYALALVVQACIEYQADSEHPDPLHVSAHFLQATKTSTIEVQIRILKPGRSFTNILADLIQGNGSCITTHFIFGKIPPSTRPLIAPSSGYARRLPHLGHPSEAVVIAMPKFVGYTHRVHWAPDPLLQSQNGPNSPARRALTGGGMAVWGAWIELVDKDERLTPSSLAFFADCIETMSTIFPPHVTGVDMRSLWLPTLALGLEWKAPIPPPSTVHSARTVGVYVTSGYLSEPQNRHTTSVEIWTAPSNIGEGTPVEGWRDAQVCLAVATQMQLMMSASANEKAGARL
ncbi:thioesterase-like superfamily-domain-containing protein [Mycena albidolilacea]|uniref:Thioesterase-like superfamily-domain-containing protein n=1 Tax=Mycena albidolilacea TaxID=1033008 RepID=A0AAD7A3K4_9AGAR|nr:thioesterase-like superfamily-domain-containing protein [Mycena albidolilacea]